jgi:hypothetical protein
MVLVSSNYKTFLSEQTISQIDYLIEENYNVDEMLAFIDNYGENEFVLYYEDYSEAKKSLGESVVEAYISEYDFSDIASIYECFVDWYSSESDFAEDYVTNQLGEKVPSCIVVDWEETWNRNLMYDFDSVDVYRSTGKGYGVYIFRKYI